MVLGIGTDIIEIARVKKALENKAFIERVFSKTEQDYCEARGAQAAASYAARFAGKEAVMKALGTGLAGGRLLEIEIMPDEKGKPQVFLSGSFALLAAENKVEQVMISLSHCRDYATAQAILVGGNKNENCDGV